MSTTDERRAAAEPVEWALYEETSKMLTAALTRIGQLEAALAQAGVAVPSPDPAVEAALAAAKT